MKLFKRNNLNRRNRTQIYKSRLNLLIHHHNFLEQCNKKHEEKRVGRLERCHSGGTCQTQLG